MNPATKDAGMTISQGRIEIHGSCACGDCAGGAKDSGSVW